MIASNSFKKLNNISFFFFLQDGAEGIASQLRGPRFDVGSLARPFFCSFVCFFEDEPIELIEMKQIISKPLYYNLFNHGSFCRAKWMLHREFLNTGIR